MFITIRMHIFKQIKITIIIIVIIIITTSDLRTCPVKTTTSIDVAIYEASTWQLGKLSNVIPPTSASISRYHD